MSDGTDKGDGMDLVLPAFEMDCRDWLVVGPAEAGLPEDVAGAPLLAVLSTVVIGADLEEATGALTVGGRDANEDPHTRAAARGPSPFGLGEESQPPGPRRYVMPGPGEHR